MKEQLRMLLQNAVPQDEKIALFFSGGIDSLLTAKILKDAGKNFVCYTIATSKNSPDFIYAKKAAKSLHLKWKYKIVSEKETEEMIKNVIKVIKTANPVKIGISLPLFAACGFTGEKTVMTGTGADEIFGGYHRYKSSENLNKECKKDTKNIEKENIFLNKIFKHFGKIHKTLFLNKNVIKFGLSLDSKMKIKNGIEKYILRELAVDLSIANELAFRKKKAAQYGSGFDRIIEKLARPLTKTEYLKGFL